MNDRTKRNIVFEKMDNVVMTVGMPPGPRGFSHLTNKISPYRCSTEPNHREEPIPLWSQGSTKAHVFLKNFSSMQSSFGWNITGNISRVKAMAVQRFEKMNKCVALA